VSKTSESYDEVAAGHKTTALLLCQTSLHCEKRQILPVRKPSEPT